MKKNKTGYTGVYKTKTGKYLAKYAGVNHGSYDTPEEASAVYNRKKEEAK